MIGDRSHDMIGACRNAMTPVGVLYGFGSEAELRAAGAMQIAVTPDDLPAAIARAGNPLPPEDAGV
jgi:phosphoglycolate phosphatase